MELAPSVNVIVEPTRPVKCRAWQIHRPDPQMDTIDFGVRVCVLYFDLTEWRIYKLQYLLALLW